MVVKKLPRPARVPLPLRAQAEAMLSCALPIPVSERSAEELLHELRVHQIELEMQNETLRQTQLVLEESRDRYMDLYEFAPVGYLTLTNIGLISEINLTCASLLGRDRAKLLNSRFARFVVAEDSERWHLCFGHALKRGGKRTCELRLRRHDGSCFDAKLDCLVSRAGDIAVPTLRVTVTDITELRKLEHELRGSQTNLRCIMDNSPYWIWMKDTEGRYITVNNAYAEFLGLQDAEQAPGKTDLDFFPEALAKKYRADDVEVMSLRRPMRIEEELEFGATGLRWLETYKSPIIDAHGKLLGTAGFARNITGRKQEEFAENRLASLTPRQRQILHLVTAGQSSKTIASELGISQRTVENHRASIMKKTDTKSIQSLALLVLTSSWIDPD